MQLGLQLPSDRTSPACSHHSSESVAQLSSRNMNLLSQAGLVSDCPLLHAFLTGCGTRSGKPLRLHLSHHLSETCPFGDPSGLSSWRRRARRRRESWRLQLQVHSFQTGVLSDNR